MPVIEQTLISKLASDWIGRTWRYLPRGAGLDWWKTADDHSSRT